jgi:hypothetical protein
MCVAHGRDTLRFYKEKIEVVDAWNGHTVDEFKKYQTIRNFNV